ncbi:Myc-type, basic helix-loop-helix domain-containing protein, partial [Tanacetum coccineum]
MEKNRWSESFVELAQMVPLVWREGAESKLSRRAAESSRVEKQSGPQDSRVTNETFKEWVRIAFHSCTSGVSTPGLDGEMYYGQLEEILELTYIGHRKVVLFRCKWFDTINPKNHTTRNRRSYIDQGIHYILTDREFHKNNQYILATQETQVFYLQDLARQPRGWKVVERVYHRDVAESDQDVIHDSSSSHVTLSIGLTCLEHTNLSINAQSTEVDAPSVNDDNANANKDNADFINNEDDVVAHVLDDDDVVVSDD